MIWQYLTSNIKGAASGIYYGLKGDRVSVVSNNIEMILVVNERGEKFYVKADDISSTQILRNAKDELLPLQNTSIYKSRSKSATGKRVSQQSGKLF